MTPMDLFVWGWYLMGIMLAFTVSLGLIGFLIGDDDRSGTSIAGLMIGTIASLVIVPIGLVLLWGGALVLALIGG